MMNKLMGRMLILSLVAIANQTLSQNSTSDTSRLNSALQTSIDFFNEKVGGDLHLFNGPAHRGYMRPATSHPYFLTEEIQIGNLSYDGIYYRNVPLMYDILNDNLVTLEYVRDSSITYRSIFKMDLSRQKTESFELFGNQFIKLKADSNTVGMKPGFYEVPYNGKVKLLVRRTKVYVEDIRGRELERRYDSISTFYVLKGGIYTNIKSKKTLLSVFKDKKGELSAYIRKNKWRFRKHKEAMILGVTSYYEQLTN